MTVEHKLITGESFDQFLAAYPDGLYELVHGEIVEKGPTQGHAKIAGILSEDVIKFYKANAPENPVIFRGDCRGW